MGASYDSPAGPQDADGGDREHGPLYPAIEFQDGTWYREESKEMERTIREGRLTWFDDDDQLTTRYT